MIVVQITQIFFLRVPSCNYVANFLVIFIAAINPMPWGFRTGG
jgi:hypothetical protein